jgi:hypothetical protein
LARPSEEEAEKKPALRYAPPLAAALYALCPLDVLTASTPAMEPLAVLLLVLHAALSQTETSTRRSLAAGLCLALACLTRYEAWGYLVCALLALWFFAPRPAWKTIALRYGPALVVCALWAVAAGFAALGEKLSPEAARHTGEMASLGAMAGRGLVLVQTLLLAAPVLLPAGVAGFLSRQRLPAGSRLFALFLLGALLAGVTLGKIAGSHRYLALGLPWLAISAARLWLGASRGQAWLAAGLPVLGFGLAGLAEWGRLSLGWDLGLFWFYDQTWPLLCLAGAVVLVGLSVSRPRVAGLCGAALAGLAMLAYWPKLSAYEIGKFVLPFRDVGAYLRLEETPGRVVFDNPVPAYFSGLPVSQIEMANRPREAAHWLGEDLTAKIAAGESSPEEVREALRKLGVSHIVTEEVPYLFTRASLLSALPAGSLSPAFWTRAIVFREIAVFRVR